MSRLTMSGASGAICALALTLPLIAQSTQSSAEQKIDLAELLSAGKLRATNREAKPLSGATRAVHVTESAGPGVVWIEGTDFGGGHHRT